ncbi:MAG: 2,3-bisphosphoglycerate-independent phosphoglycerate mutase [Thermodesulfobacteriota bacterium]|nr:2,3-bisphosphoglycerate-independent phosphoglycerate mutase [Thermodesulfobacteriota bacterium]
MTKNNKRVDALIILDGWGINPDKKGNAVAIANTPFLDMIEDKYPCTHLLCSGESVGLPAGIMGNSEVGHMNIGAGRKVLQNLVKINKSIKDGSFFQNRQFINVMERVKREDKILHIMGLLSDGGVHSHMNHLFALIDMAQNQGVKKLKIHVILDGRDTPPKSGAGYVEKLVQYLAEKEIGEIATICGRYYAMDRDNRWNRVEKAYNLYTMGVGKEKKDPVKAVTDAYEQGQTDEFLMPVLLTENPDKADKTNEFDKSRETIKDNDGFIFFNFRADRAREITRAFTEKKFTDFERKAFIDIPDFLCMTLYDESFTLPVAFGPQHFSNILGEIISNHGMSQLRIAETEKYAHVTYFFNGGDEKIFPLEKRMLIPSPKEVATYDEKPEMSAQQVADAACEKIESGDFRFVVLNFANMDMVGHTGILEACVKGCETVDKCAEQVVKKIWETGGTAMVTADHGNAENMIAKDGSPHTAHTLNPVRFIIAGKEYVGQKLKNGILGDIAPTVLEVMGIDKPNEMTGTSLFV